MRNDTAGELRQWREAIRANCGAAQACISLWPADSCGSEGVKTCTYILFERTGRIALIRLLKILDVLELANEFDHIGREEDLTGMTLAQITRPERRRGVRKRV